jgi:hypothetical protein
VIVFVLETIISHSGESYHLYVAQDVWWIVSIIRYQQDLVFCIKNLQAWETIETSNLEPTGTNIETLDQSEYKEWNDKITKDCEKSQQKSKSNRKSITGDRL